MLLEIDQVALPAALLQRLRAKDAAAIAEAGRLLDGVELYVHALSAEPGDEVVGLRELESIGVVACVRLVANTQ